MRTAIQIIEGVSEGCARAMLVSGVALVGSLTLSFWRPSEQIADASERVFVKSLEIILISGIGSAASAFGLSKLADRNVRRWQDQFWEGLVKKLWATEYCVASCRGCKHLVGEVGADKYMVCGMHPYGWKDWEEKWQCPDYEEGVRSQDN